MVAGIFGVFLVGRSILRAFGAVEDKHQDDADQPQGSSGEESNRCLAHLGTSFSSSIAKPRNMKVAPNPKINSNPVGPLVITGFSTAIPNETLLMS
jgi:hypothetical protein